MFVIGEKEYTFGGICFEFYYSGELQKEFPITGRGFIPVKELEENNKEFLANKKETRRRGEKKRKKKLKRKLQSNLES